MRLTSTLALGVLALGFAVLPALADSTRPAYGCFKVSATELSVRESSFATGATIATASKNEILVKRRRFCSARWCAVTTNKGIQGYAEKSMMAVAPCPARLSIQTK